MNFLTPPNRKYVREGRPHDYVYDQVYTTSSRKDFFKSAGRGAQAGAKIQLRPVYPTMFSELMRDRRLDACLIMQKPNVLENFMPQHRIGGIPISPMDTGPAYTREVEVTGADRAKFIIKYAPETYVMARPVVEYNLEDEKRKNRKRRRPKGHFINRGVQTDFRESETQTDPFTPQYTLPYPDAYPKVMALMKLTWGKGLPATLEDIVVIERALTRRILEVGSRDVENDEDFERRVKLMEELEAQQWADREKELSQIMAQKMDLISKLLIDLRSKIVNEHTMKMEKTYEVTKKANVKYLADLKNRYLRGERKLDMKYTSPPKSFKRDIVKEYLEYDSQVYAPLVRNGPNLDMLHKAPELLFPQYRNLEELDQILNDESFVRKELEFNIEGFVKKVRKIKLPGKDRRMEKKLDEVFNAFRSESNKKDDYDDAAILKQMMNTVKRTDTPTYEGIPWEEDQMNQAILVLQKTIRGRAVQVMMRDEINGNMETMLAMKSLHKADPFGLKATFGEVAAMRNLQNQREEQQEKKNEVTEITDQLEGETLGRMLDYLDKEMVRLLDERKIHALLILAERERRMREAIEAGNRAREEETRRTNDEVFRQIVGIHQSTVDLYLEDMYLETMNRTADDNARLHVQNLARTLNEAAYLTDHNFGEDEEEIAAELVHSFLIPEMNRIYQRQRLDSLRSRYTQAATHVTEATCSAQGLVKEILDIVGPSLTKHMMAGESAVDGAQLAMEYIIKQAVEKMLKETEPHLFDQAADEEEEGEGDEETPPEISRQSSKSRSSKSRDSTPRGDKEDRMEPIPREQTDSSGSSAYLDLDSTEGTDEPSSDEPKPWSPIPVHPDMKKLLGEKSLDLAYKSEIGQEATALFQNVSTVVDGVFTDMLHCVLPPKTPEEATENSFDDDEDEK